MSATRDWVEAGEETAAEMSRGECRVLLVGDGTVGHARRLWAGETIGAGLDDYAAGYDASDCGAPKGKAHIKVAWTLYENGAETKAGTWSFLA